MLGRSDTIGLFCILAFTAFASGCGGEDTSQGDEQDLFGKGKVPKEWDRQVERPASEDQAAASRAACEFRKGSMPAETHGAEVPVDKDIPIKNIIVVMQENRSFDSYYGHLARYLNRTDIESAPDEATNPEKVDSADSTQHPWQHAKTLCISDTNHEWGGTHLEYDGGAMDGFFQANQGFKEKGQPAVGADLVSGERALWWYDERDIPFYYELAGTFAIGDHYHSSLLGPTWPNRDYLYGATSMGVTGATRPDLSDLHFPAHDAVVFDELQRRRISWKFYVSGAIPAARIATFVSPVAMLTRWAGIHIRGMNEFMEDARKGTLPQVAFLDGNIHEDVDGNDEHPPGDIQNGQKYVSDVVHAVFKSPQWKETAMFLVYDEHGGLYDHVTPPPACVPDDLDPDLKTSEDQEYPGAFDTLGVRVPVVVISPYAKKGYVSHHVFDHTSITRFIEAKFKVPALSNRDANAEAMYDFFDFSSPAFATPPALSEAVIDQTRLKECQMLYPKNGAKTTEEDALSPGAN